MDTQHPPEKELTDDDLVNSVHIKSESGEDEEDVDLNVLNPTLRDARAAAESVL